MKEGYTGISHPFRIGTKGGLVLSTTDSTNIDHIVEGMEQRLRTPVGERVMEYNFGNSSDFAIFNTKSEALKNLLKFEAAECLNKDDRITVDAEDIEVEVVRENDGSSSVYVDVTFKVISYNTIHNTKIKLVTLGGNEVGK